MTSAMYGNQSLCGDQYTPSAGIAPLSRIVQCTMPAEHGGEVHMEIETGSTWPRLTWEWVASRRYGYFAVDRYDRSGDSHVTHGQAMIFSIRRDADRVAYALNAAYRLGLDESRGKREQDLT